MFYANADKIHGLIDFFMADILILDDFAIK